MTAFIPLSQMNDGTVRSDFHFLEDVLGQVDSSRRAIPSPVGGGNAHKKARHKSDDYGDDTKSSHPLLSACPEGSLLTGPHSSRPNNLHPKWRHFQQLARERGTLVMFLPSGMYRHKTNKSCVKNKVLHWTVDVVTHSIRPTSSLSSVTSLDVCESVLLRDIRAKITLESDGPPEEDCAILMKRLPCPSNAPVYNRLDPSSTLADALRDMTVMEYPTLELVPPERLDDFCVAVQDATEKSTAQDDACSNII